MRLRPALVLASLALLLGAGCVRRVPPAAPGPGEELQERQTAFLAALGTRDLEGTILHFADDAVVHVANLPALRGRGAIERFYGNVFRYMSASTPTPETLRVASGGDMAHGTGGVVNVFEGAGGRTEYRGKYVLVWERHHGTWMIVFYGISNDQAEPAPSP